MSTEDEAPLSYDNFISVMPVLKRIAEFEQKMNEIRATIPNQDTRLAIIHSRMGLYRTNAEFRALKQLLDDHIRPLEGYARTWPIHEVEALVAANSETLSFGDTLRALKARRDGTGHEKVEAWARFEAFLTRFRDRITWIDEADMRQGMSRTFP